MTIQTTTNVFINSCLDVNSSWREFFNEMALLWTLDLDLDAGWTVIGDCIKENLIENGIEEEISDAEVDGLICGYLNAECVPFTKEQVLVMEDWAREIAEGCDAEDQLNEWIAAN